LFSYTNKEFILQATVSYTAEWEAFASYSTRRALPQLKPWFLECVWWDSLYL